jgi:intracellular septation protein A
MSGILNLALWIHGIVSVVLGALWLVIPGRFLTWLGWAPIDPILSRVLGASLLAMAWGDFRVWRRASQAEAGIWAEVQLAFAALAGIGVLRHLVAGRFPATVWILFGLFGMFALIWLAGLVRGRP